MAQRLIVRFTSGFVVCATAGWSRSGTVFQELRLVWRPRLSRHAPPPFPCVLKLGGSLLRQRELRRLCCELAALADSPLWVVGGGEVADVVRGWDSRHNLGDAASHRLALAAMGWNAQLLEALVPRFERVGDAEQAAKAVAAGNWPIVDALAWTETREAAGASPLPRTWDVTSDSVAAWIARDLGVTCLWLAKSVDAPSPADAPDDPKVDPHFAQQSRGLPQRKWVNAARLPLIVEDF